MVGAEDWAKARKRVSPLGRDLLIQIVQAVGNTYFKDGVRTGLGVNRNMSRRVLEISDHQTGTPSPGASGIFQGVCGQERSEKLISRPSGSAQALPRAPEGPKHLSQPKSELEHAWGLKHSGTK